MILLLTFAASAVELAIVGTCPGPATIVVEGATPLGELAMAAGTSLDGALIPDGPCVDAPLELGGDLLLLATPTADADGTLTLPVSLPDAACGNHLEAVDLTTCEASGAALFSDVCLFPEAPLDDSGPGGPRVTPVFLDLAIDLWTDGAATTAYDEDGPIGARLTTTLLDDAGWPICTVQHDAAGAVALPPGGYDLRDFHGDPLAFPATNVWELDLSDGWTDCGRLTVPVHLTDDPRTVWGHSLVIALGAAVGTKDVLPDIVEADGGDWDRDWNPWVSGLYVATDGDGLRELGWVFTHGGVCGVLDHDDAGARVRLPSLSDRSSPRPMHVEGALVYPILIE